MSLPPDKTYGCPLLLKVAAVPAAPPAKLAALTPKEAAFNAFSGLSAAHWKAADAASLRDLIVILFDGEKDKACFRCISAAKKKSWIAKRCSRLIKNKSANYFRQKLQTCILKRLNYYLHLMTKINNLLRNGRWGRRSPIIKTGLS